MKLNKLVDPNFQLTLRKLASQEIPLKTAYKLKGIIKVCNEELAKYDDVRTDALNRYGTKKEDGSLDIDNDGSVKLSTENKQLFVDELNALLVTDIAVTPVSISELGDKVSLTTQELMILDDLITE